jgi:hypothetical protein
VAELWSLGACHVVTKLQLYHSGDEIHAGDSVRYAGMPSVIVFVNDTCEYLSGFDATEWSYLGSGFMMRQENGALIYLGEADEDLELIQRA